MSRWFSPDFESDFGQEIESATVTWDQRIGDDATIGSTGGKRTQAWKLSDGSGSGSISIMITTGTDTFCCKGWRAEHGRDVVAGCWSTFDYTVSIGEAPKS